MAFVSSTATIEASAASFARLWGQVTPAAGVRIRSATSFRAFVTSSSGTASVDIYQLNSDGTSTKLATLPSSTTGVYGGPYTTTNAAAIYWQFSTLPSVLPAPVAVNVTFINDAPSVPLTAMYTGAPPQTPFASTDSSLLLNLDLRKGVPPGWTSYGFGTFDATNGYTPGTLSASGLANNSVPGFASTAEMPQGTVALRFQRTGVTTDNSFPPYFWDSTGNTLNAATQDRQLFIMRANSGNWVFAAVIQAASVPYIEFAFQSNSMTQPNHFEWQTMNSHYVPGYQDATFADLVITWYQNQYYVFFDGHLVNSGTLGDVPTLQMFQNICIGNYNGSGQPAGAPFGAYAIQQVQISSRFLGPVMAGPTIGILGDSFVASYTQRATPTATAPGGYLQASDIDNVQNSLGLYSGLAALTVQSGQTSTFHEIQALMFETYGFYPPIYNAGDPGHGFSQLLLPIDDAYIAALNQATPSIVVAEGSVNDVNQFNPSDATLLSDTQTYMQRLVLGGGSRIAAPANTLLEDIIYLEMLSSQGLPSANQYVEPGYGTESQNLITITRNGMSDYAPPNATAFSYIKSREWWNQASDYPYYLLGTSPNNPYIGPGGRDWLNVHPGPTGFSVIASELFTPVANAIMTTAGASVALSGSATEKAGGLATLSLAIANAGPLVATGVTVTATLPVGATLVSAASSAGCAQKAQVLTCTVPPISASQSAPLNISLQVNSGLALNTTFVLSTATYNPNVGGATLAVSVPSPAGSGGTDAPFPLWAIASLGVGLLGIAARRGSRTASP
jgi:uncharacterized repeat protein (TIGR01451 family)